MTKHTKGPWHVSKAGQHVRWIQTDGTCPNICEVENQPEQEANARLIATAPDLAEFAEWIANASIEPENDTPLAAIRAATQFIQEARARAAALVNKVGGK